MRRRILDNDTFVNKNFERLVKKYAHQHIVICREEVFSGKDAMLRARKKFPNFIPMLLPVPAPEEFNHLL